MPAKVGPCDPDSQWPKQCFCVFAAAVCKELAILQTPVAISLSRLDT